MTETLENSYEILNQIGRGSYASVHRAINRHTSEICAIKKIPITSELTNLFNEIKIMEECDCENIVRLLTSTCSDTEVSIVMEYCCGGSVKDVMRQLNRTITQEQITVILKDVLTGLDYLHSKNKIHRDVKAANILLNREGIAKLGDFGVSEPVDPNYRKQSIIGTLLWLPPEVINQDPNYSSVIDIWSLGITIIEMGDGQPPYSELDQKVALSEIANLAKIAPSFRDKSKWSPILLNFLQLCLEKDSSIRINARQLLTHDIIKNAAPREVIKSLVTEVCSATTNNETESSLYRKAKLILQELNVLFNTDKEMMKVIKVDIIANYLNSYKSEFSELCEKLIPQMIRYEEVKSRAKILERDVMLLERERNAQRATLANLELKRRTLKECLSHVGEQEKK